MDAATLKQLIEQCKSDPSILNDPSLSFFRSYIESLGGRVLRPRNPNVSLTFFFTVKIPTDDLEELIVESDVELDEADIVEPDDDTPQKMADPSVEEVSEENRDAAQMLKSKAVLMIDEGQLYVALSHLTEAIMLNPCSAILYATRGAAYVKDKKPNAAIRDADAALQINPDSAKAHKVRGMARAMLGHWVESAKDLHVASKLDYDEEIGSVLKKVEANVNKLEAHRRKYECLRKEKELKKIELEKQQQRTAEVAQLKSLLKDGQVIGIPSGSELDKKLNASRRLGRLAVLYFTATWCGPCRSIAPVYATLAGKYPHVVFMKVDIDDAGDVASQYNISSVPAFFFIKDGKEIDTVVGADKNSLEKKVAQYA